MIEVCGKLVRQEDIDAARSEAEFFRMRGFQPLPSDPGRKKPLVRFSTHWEKKFEEDLFEKHPSCNIQVMTGRFWGLIVYDLDGPEAQGVWNQWWSRHGKTPKTWVTHSGGKGQHWWFTIPKDYPHDMPKADLWVGEGEHSGIERLCDRSLIMAPPSIHPENGRRYLYRKYHDPSTVPYPSPCPAWLLAMKPIIQKPEYVPPNPHIAVPRKPQRPGVKRYERDDVIAAIHDKVSLVESWGIRFRTKRPGPSGWCECHSFDRQDEHASAAVNVETGGYTDRGSGQRLDLFNLAVALGVYPTRGDAINQLGEQYRVRIGWSP